MRPSTIGLLAGIALGFAGAFGGFTAFIVVLVVGAAGFLIGLAVDTNVDIRDYLGGGRGRR